MDMSISCTRVTPQMTDGHRDGVGVVKTPETSGRRKGSRGRAQGRSGAAVATPNTPMPVSAAARGQEARAEKPKTPVGGKLSLGEEALLCWAVSVCALAHSHGSFLAALAV
jgi:hypothetical protein